MMANRLTLAALRVRLREGNRRPHERGHEEARDRLPGLSRRHHGLGRLDLLRGRRL